MLSVRLDEEIEARLQATCDRLGLSKTEAVKRSLSSSKVNIRLSVAMGASTRVRRRVAAMRFGDVQPAPLRLIAQSRPSEFPVRGTQSEPTGDIPLVIQSGLDPKVPQRRFRAHLPFGAPTRGDAVKHDHPKTDRHGDPVLLRHPNTRTVPDNSHDPNRAATVVPDSTMPPILNGIALDTWQAPHRPAFRETEAEGAELEEPSFRRPKHKKARAGAVVEEPDGRFWLVALSNGFGGYQDTFPKGTVEPGASRCATALKEVYEETELRLRLIAHSVVFFVSPWATRLRSSAGVGPRRSGADRAGADQAWWVRLDRRHAFVANATRRRRNGPFRLVSR